LGGVSSQPTASVGINRYFAFIDTTSVHRKVLSPPASLKQNSHSNSSDAKWSGHKISTARTSEDSTTQTDLAADNIEKPPPLPEDQLSCVPHSKRRGMTMLVRTHTILSSSFLLQSSLSKGTVMSISTLEQARNLGILNRTHSLRL
jgi:hypothetical protein